MIESHVMIGGALSLLLLALPTALGAGIRPTTPFDRKKSSPPLSFVEMAESESATAATPLPSSSSGYPSYPGQYPTYPAYPGYGAYPPHPLLEY